MAASVRSSIRSFVVRRTVGRFDVPRDAVRFTTKRYGIRTALIDGDTSLTYDQLRDRHLRLANAWQRADINKGDVVFCLLPDGAAIIETRLASYESGILLTQFHADTSAEQILAAAELIKPDLFIYDPTLAQESADILQERHPDLQVWNIRSGEYERQLAAAKPVSSTTAIEPSHIMGVGFSSGTTGKPKALVSSHGTIIASLQLVLKNIRIDAGSKTPDKAMAGIPLTGAGSGILLPTLLSGGTLIITPRYEATTLAALVEQHRITRLFVTPSMLIDLLDLPSEAHDLSSLTNVIYGTEVTAGAKLQEAIKRFGPIFQQGYGSAEVMPPVSMLQPHEHVDSYGQPVGLDILASAGTIIPEVSVRILDKNGLNAPTGQIGDILVKSPTLFDGYYGSEEPGTVQPATIQPATTDGWFELGDVGYVTRERRLHVLGRKADIVAGHDGPIYPRLVEEIVHQHQMVKECCLVEAAGQAILVVSPRRRFFDGIAGDVPAFVADLTRFIETKSPDGDMPADIRVVAELPRSGLAKVIRREVRELVASGQLVQLVPGDKFGLPPVLPTVTTTSPPTYSRFERAATA